MIGLFTSRATLKYAVEQEVQIHDFWMFYEGHSPPKFTWTTVVSDYDIVPTVRSVIYHTVSDNFQK